MPSCVLCGYLLWLEIIEPSLPQAPAFNFSVLGTENPLDRLWLTNNPFIFVNWGKTERVSGGVLVPIRLEQSNFVLRLSVRPNAFAEDLEVGVNFPAQWGASPSKAWIRSFDETAKGVLESNGLVLERKVIQTWGYRCPISVLPGDSISLPEIVFTNVGPLIVSPTRIASQQYGSVDIFAKAKGVAAAGVTFRPFLLPVTSEYSRKPIAVTLFPTNGGRLGVWFPYPLKQTNGF